MTSRAPLDRLQILQIIGLLTQAFLILFTYALARPAIESLFLKHYTSQALPSVWIAVGLGSFVSVFFYNRFAGRLPLLRLFGYAALWIGGICLLLVAALHLELPGAVFALYIWKDLYIITLVEIFWSFANVSFPTQTAKWIYGLFGMMGAIGGVIGNLVVGKLAKIVGSSGLLWSLPPLFVAIGWLARLLHRLRPAVEEIKTQPRPAMHFTEGWQIVLRSRYLLFVMLLIATVQIATTLIDYQTNWFLERAYPDLNHRTQVIGWIYAATDAGTIFFHLTTGLWLARFGLPVILLAVPILLCGGIVSFILLGHFTALAITKILNKTMDYSIFRSAKEILYIPLTYREKTEGKAVVDMLTYRVAKGAASLLIVLLGLLHLRTPAMLQALMLLCLLVWVVLTLVILRRYRAEPP